MPFSVAYDGNLTVSGIPGTPIASQTTPIETGIDFPAVVAAGYAVEPTKRLRLEADIDWTLWNAVDDIVIRARNGARFMDGTTQQPPMRQGLENTLTWKIGAQYMCADGLAVRAGYIYNQNATPDASWRPSLPDTDTHFFMLGGGYKVGDVTVDAALQVVYYEKRTIDNNVDGNESTSSSSVDGTYRNWAPCVSVGLTYGF
jgi:long-subunit fatty acid transport protein